MNTIATIARERAVNCEVRKIAYRQSKDGIVVSFVVHPNEMPAGLATSQLGTRYILALVELDDEDMPKEVRPHSEPRRSVSADKTPPASEDSTTPARARKLSWTEYPASQQSGILCSDPAFRKFASEFSNRDLSEPGATTEWVRAYCRVKSRSELTTDNAYWHQIVERYRTWQLAAQVVP